MSVTVDPVRVAVGQTAIVSAYFPGDAYGLVGFQQDGSVNLETPSDWAGSRAYGGRYATSSDGTVVPLQNVPALKPDGGNGGSGGMNTDLVLTPAGTPDITISAWVQVDDSGHDGQVARFAGTNAGYARGLGYAAGAIGRWPRAMPSSTPAFRYSLAGTT